MVVEMLIMRERLVSQKCDEMPKFEKKHISVKQLIHVSSPRTYFFWGGDEPFREATAANIATVGISTKLQFSEKKCL